MKKEELPQDKSKLADFTRELLYVKNKEGQYEKELSTGWDIKSDALNCAWDEIARRTNFAKESVAAGSKSPVFYFMELNLMDLATLAAYTGFWKWSVKRHLKPAVFKKLNHQKLEKYAKTFKISVDELIHFDGTN